MFIPHTCKDLFFHGFNSFCINDAIFGWEINGMNKHISHQSSKAMQILHTQTWLPTKKNIIYFLLAYISLKQLEEHQIHITGATLVAC